MAVCEKHGVDDRYRSGRCRLCVKEANARSINKLRTLAGVATKDQRIERLRTFIRDAHGDAVLAVVDPLPREVE